MKSDTRQQQILDLASRQGFVSIDGLSRQFEVTPQTIRRDINQLCDQGLLERHHGGAVPRSSTHNVDYVERKALGSEDRAALTLSAKLEWAGIRADELLQGALFHLLHLMDVSQPELGPPLGGLGSHTRERPQR